MINVMDQYREMIQELWGLGYTLVPRSKSPDPLHVDPAIIPANRAYQWLPIRPDPVLKEGYRDWTPVCHEDHPGIFAPYGTLGAVERMGMVLCWKPKADVEVERAKERAKVLKQELDWARRFGAHGITGGVRRVLFEGDQAHVTEIDVGKAEGTEKVVEAVERAVEKAVELITEIPRDMRAYLPAIFEERDRLREEIVQVDRTLKPGEIADKFYAALNAAIDADEPFPWWPTLHAILLPYAIANVRKAVFQPNPSQAETTS